MAWFGFRPSRFLHRTTSAQTNRETATTLQTSSSSNNSTAAKSPSPTRPHRRTPQSAVAFHSSPCLAHARLRDAIPADQEDISARKDDEARRAHSRTPTPRQTSDSQTDDQTLGGSDTELNLDDKDDYSPVPAVTVEQPTPDAPPRQQDRPETGHSVREVIISSLRDPGLPDDPNPSVNVLSEESEQAEKDIADVGHPHTPSASVHERFDTHDFSTMAHPLHRKIWVKRPGGSATLVKIKEDDLVDDVRDMILQKYANSLGKTFDSPDMTLRISQRTDNSGIRQERMLGPEEEICQALDDCYSGGQTVEEALIIDVPQKRTPKPSPRIYQTQSYHMVEDNRPHENGTEYFPPMPVLPSTTPLTTSSHESRHHHAHAHPDQLPRAMSVLNTGQLPALPSPGATRRHRPSNRRHPTSSPTLLTAGNAATSSATVPNSLNPLLHRQMTSRPHNGSTASDAQYLSNGVPVAPPLPTPPISEATIFNKSGSRPPTPNGVTSAVPHRVSRPAKKRNSTPDRPLTKSQHPNNNAGLSNLGLANSMLDGAVPPINVLIVEDNIINLRILESLMKRLKVRWQTAMNGQIAVDKWRAGGFHLVLMDIQMPIMNGLQATKEIRRLERVNGIGVFSSLGSTTTSPSSVNGDAEVDGHEKHTTEEIEGATEEEATADPDKLVITAGLFKSPIIIVALTASSLQSDRHEALAAGCNDFLTKPVDFMWLERKVKEWGCMQALIDFDGWRKWKDYATEKEASKSEAEKKLDREREERARVKAEKMALLQEKLRIKKEQDEHKKKRQSIDPVAPIAETGE